MCHNKVIWTEHKEVTEQMPLYRELFLQNLPINIIWDWRTLEQTLIGKILQANESASEIRTCAIFSVNPNTYCEKERSETESLTLFVHCYPLRGCASMYVYIFRPCGFTA